VLKIAILGANGFIGSRAVEVFHLASLAEVHPVVRTTHSLARLSRFNLECHVANAFDQQALQTAFEGCEIVVHAIAGDNKTIVESLAPTYNAAQAAGVRRMVYLSTASVHGQSPQAGTDENSVLNDRQEIAYNNSKVHAEWQLKKLRQNGSVEIVLLRPGIVFGPRSFWITNFVSDLLNGKAYIVNGGQGICNSIYVDNLIHAIYKACDAKDADGEAFIVGDEETITWADFYLPFAEALGKNLSDVHQVIYQPASKTSKERVKDFLESPMGRTIVSAVPSKLFKATKASVSILLSKPENRSSWTLPKLHQHPIDKPSASLEMALLHQCPYKLPDVKARKMLGYQPPVTFNEACRRTVGWLLFAGYPILRYAKELK
jgi:nucleoside-diphosphate-sugar epimerase